MVEHFDDWSARFDRPFSIRRSWILIELGTT
jgi:hypothetical protein